MENENKRGGFVRATLFGSGIAVISALALILIFALVISLASLPESAVKPVNQFIKVISVFFGCILAVRGGMGWIKGVLRGLLFTAVIYLVFGLIGNEFKFAPFLIDLIFCAVAGLISGIISVSVKRK